MFDTKDVEFNDLEIKLYSDNLKPFLKLLYMEGYSSHWEETQDEQKYTLNLKKKDRNHIFKLTHNNGVYQITGDYFITDQDFIKLMLTIIKFSKGNAIIKHFKKGYLLIKNIEVGEIIRVTKVSFNEKKVLVDRSRYKLLIDIERNMSSNKVEIEISTLKLELNYELLTLHEAISAKDGDLITECKNKLQRIYRQLIILEYF